MGNSSPPRPSCSEQEDEVFLDTPYKATICDACSSCRMTGRAQQAPEPRLEEDMWEGKGSGGVEITAWGRHSHGLQGVLAKRPFGLPQAEK